MTILQVCAFAAPNAGNFIACLTRLEKALDEKGVHTIYAFCDGAQDKDWCKEIQKRTEVYFLPTRHARILPETYQKMKEIYAKHDVSVVHSHFELYDIPATIMAPKGVKVFWHLHDAVQEHYEKAGNVKKLLIKLQYGMFSRRATLLSVSEKHAAFVERLGFSRERIVYFPNGINTKRIHRLEQLKEDGCLLMFGWEVYRKGVDVVVKAMEKVVCENCKVVIIGQKECQKYLKEHGSDARLEYRCPVNDINQLYSQAKAFIHVSRSEGLSYALLEAIYAGLPVICSDIPENGFARVFKNVFFVPNEDDKAIAEKIDDICTQKQVFSPELAEYNRRIIEQDYSLEAWVSHLMQYYLG